MNDPLEMLAREIQATVSGLNAVQTQASPPDQPRKWSIQQIIQHLNLSYETTAQVLKVRIEKERPTQAAPTLVQRAAQFAIINLGRFPKGREAPAAVTPALVDLVYTGDELARRAKAHLEEISRLAARGEELFGTRRAASHLVLGPLSMAQWRTFHLVHGRHHFRQIVQIRRANHL